MLSVEASASWRKEQIFLSRYKQLTKEARSNETRAIQALRASKKANFAAVAEWASSTKVASGCEEWEENESAKLKVSQRVWEHFASSIRSIPREVKYTTCQKS